MTHHPHLLMPMIFYGRMIGVPLSLFWKQFFSEMWYEEIELIKLRMEMPRPVSGSSQKMKNPQSSNNALLNIRGKS